MTNYVYVATSLDGYIASKDGGIDWLMDIPNPDGSDHGFSEFMQKVDAIVMGRNTFEQVVSFGVWGYEKPVFVLSNTLEKVPDHLKEKAEVLSGDIDSIITYLKGQGYNDLYVDGGVVIHSFLEKDLIDELIITRVSIILGSGIPLFKNIKGPLNFEHIETEVLNKDLVKSHYRRI